MDKRPSWDRVQELFNEAVELDPEGRKALLDRIESAHPELAAELRSLLVAHFEAGGFLAGSVAAGFGETGAPGQRIGPYRILEEIGRGGMGVVYRAARDDEDFSKEVAVKRIYPGLRSEDILRRFRSERQILAMLDHPHIARLIDGGTAADGSPYLVMDYVSGKPLLAFCDDRRLGVEERLAIFLEVCDAVQFAHQRLVIHRDLKPDNILVTDDGTPRLLDFGIAKLMPPSETGAPATVTAPMHRMMTPDYASPEQILGDPVTVAGDVYSLGVILYELLAGCRPLRLSGRAPEDILRAVAQEDPAPPSAAVIRAASGEAADRRGNTTRNLRRRLAGDLDHIALKALEKEPERRYASVDQLAADIRRHLEGHPVLARGHSTAYQLSRFIRRNRTAVVTVGLVAVSLIAGLAGTTWQAGVARQERDRAKRRFNEVRSLAHALMFDVHDAILDLPGSTRARKLIVDHALTYLNKLADDAGSDPVLQHEIGLAYAKIADVQGRPLFSNLGRTGDALDSYSRGIALLAAAAAARPESLSFSRNEIVATQRLTDLLRTMGRGDEALARARTTIERIEALIERYPDDPYLPGDLLLTHDRIGDWAVADGDTSTAVAERTLCLEMAEEIHRRYPDDGASRRPILIQYAKNAELLATRGNRDGAMALYERAERLGREAVAALGNNTEARRDLAIIYSMMAHCLAGGGAVDSGLAVYARGMRISEELAAEDSSNALMQSDVAAAHFDIGLLLLGNRRYEAAEARFREAFDRYARLAAADTSNVAVLQAMALCGRRAGDACVEASTTYRKNPGPWRDRAAGWFERSLNVYQGLGRRGVLTAEDAAAPEELTAALRTLAEGH